ncbi:MAG: hypothetical protein KDB22_26120 [Planctomycetales bacterium]|nr:hypothetical protein [Planctomycetales bacterium]
MELIQKLMAAINANNGQCPLVEEALTDAVDFVMQKTPKEKKPSIEVLTVLGRTRIQMTDGADVVCLEVSQKTLRELVQEFETVLEMARED